MLVVAEATPKSISTTWFWSSRTWSNPGGNPAIIVVIEAGPQYSKIIGSIDSPKQICCVVRVSVLVTK